MPRRWWVLLAGLATACTAPPASTPPPAAPAASVLLPGALGPSSASPQDVDMQALLIAEAAFADAGSTYGRPEAAARAAAAVEYLAGELAAAPRWAGLDPQVKADMLAAREEVRGAIGVAPAAPSQAVVDALLAAGNALAAGDAGVAERALTGPAFALPPAQVVQRLANLPYLRAANVATREAVEGS